MCWFSENNLILIQVSNRTKKIVLLRLTLQQKEVRANSAIAPTQQYHSNNKRIETLTPKNLTIRARFELVFNGKFQRTAQPAATIDK